LVGLMYAKGPLKRVMDIVSGSGSGVTQRMGRSYTYHAGMTGDFNKTNFNMVFRVVCKSQQPSNFASYSRKVAIYFHRRQTCLTKVP